MRYVQLHKQLHVGQHAVLWTDCVVCADVMLLLIRLLPNYLPVLKAPCEQRLRLPSAVQKGN